MFNLANSALIHGAIFKSLSTRPFYFLNLLLPPKKLGGWNGVNEAYQIPLMY